MNDYQAGLVAAACVKIAIVASGTTCIYLGYRLFVLGVFRGGSVVTVDAGNATAGGKKGGWRAGLAMTRGGPGLLFALFGAAIVIVGIVRDFSVSGGAVSGVDPLVVPSLALETFTQTRMQVDDGTTFVDNTSGSAALPPPGKKAAPTSSR